MFNPVFFFFQRWILKKRANLNNYLPYKRRFTLNWLPGWFPCPVGVLGGSSAWAAFAPLVAPMGVPWTNGSASGFGSSWIADSLPKRYKSYRHIKLLVDDGMILCWCCCVKLGQIVGKHLCSYGAEIMFVGVFSEDPFCVAGDGQISLWFKLK